MTEIVIYEARKHEHLVQSFADVHMACTIENPMTLANFVLPFTPERQQAVCKYWEQRLELAKPNGTDSIIMAFNEGTSGETVLSGFVILNQPVSESGPFRADVQKLFVSPDFRRMGIARKMMAKLEEVARENGRTLLTLGTARPSPARNMYPKFGYIEYGIIPNYVLNAETKEPMDEVCFYKDLTKV